MSRTIKRKSFLRCRQKNRRAAIRAKIVGNVGEQMVSVDGQPIDTFIIEGLRIDGEHHKQWYLEQILQALNFDLEQEKYKEALRQFQDDKDYWMNHEGMTETEALEYLKENVWEDGTPP